MQPISLRARPFRKSIRGILIGFTVGLGLVSFLLLLFLQVEFPFDDLFLLAPILVSIIIGIGLTKVFRHRQSALEWNYQFEVTDDGIRITSVQNDDPFHAFWMWEDVRPAMLRYRSPLPVVSLHGSRLPSERWIELDCTLETARIVVKNINWFQYTRRYVVPRR